MTVYIGVDLHVRTQTVCWCDTADGEIHERTLDHEREDVRGFYAQFAGPAVIGVESVGYAVWFHRMLEGLGHEVRVGDAYAIRKYARRRQKNDRRDAALILDLLLQNDFPAIHWPSPESRDVLGLLRYRHRLVKMRTMLKNGLQAVAYNHQLRLKTRLFTQAGRKQFAALPLEGADACQRLRSLALLDALGEQILAVEAELARRAATDRRVTLVRTHPGVGLLTSLAFVHTVEPVSRFARARQVAAYCGLDPMEHSSAERVRMGHISKQGSRLLRFLLVEASQSVVQHEEDLRRFYTRLLCQNKNSAVALTAVARKLSLRLYVLLRDQIDYDQFRLRGRDARHARDYASAAPAALSI